MLGNLPSNYKETEARAFKEADNFKRKRRDMGIFDAINENLKAKDQISYQAQEQRKTAKELAEVIRKVLLKLVMILQLIQVTRSWIHLTRCTR